MGEGEAASHGCHEGDPGPNPAGRRALTVYIGDSITDLLPMLSGPCLLSSPVLCTLAHSLRSSCPFSPVLATALQSFILFESSPVQIPPVQYPVQYPVHNTVSIQYPVQYTVASALRSLPTLPGCHHALPALSLRPLSSCQCSPTRLVHAPLITQALWPPWSTALWPLVSNALRSLMPILSSDACSRVLLGHACRFGSLRFFRVTPAPFWTRIDAIIFEMGTHLKYSQIFSGLRTLSRPYSPVPLSPTCCQCSRVLSLPSISVSLPSIRGSSMQSAYRSRARWAASDHAPALGGSGLPLNGSRLLWVAADIGIVIGESSSLIQVAAALGVVELPLLAALAPQVLHPRP